MLLLQGRSWRSLTLYSFFFSPSHVGWRGGLFDLRQERPPNIKLYFQQCTIFSNIYIYIFSLFLLYSSEINRLYSSRSNARLTSPLIGEEYIYEVTPEPKLKKNRHFVLVIQSSSLDFRWLKCEKWSASDFYRKRNLVDFHPLYFSCTTKRFTFATMIPKANWVQAVETKIKLKLY